MFSTIHASRVCRAALSFMGLHSRKTREICAQCRHLHPNIDRHAPDVENFARKFLTFKFLRGKQRSVEETEDSWGRGRVYRHSV